MSESRRPVKARSVELFHRMAKFLVQLGFSPNQISGASALFAILGGISIYAASLATGPVEKTLFLIGGLVGIQLRLICNLIDGLMAVEGGKKTPMGEFFNDFPDRISDVALILFTGYALHLELQITLAWAASLLAVITAYIRVLGASMGAPHFFLGPMAKQHRMATLNLGLAAGIVEVFTKGGFEYSLSIALFVITLGSAITCLRRGIALQNHFYSAQKRD